MLPNRLPVMSYSNKRLLLALIAIVVVASVTPHAGAQGFQPDKQVLYKSVGDVELKLHVFEPPGHQASDRAPAIVFFFGGGWSSGTPRQFYEQCDLLAKYGVVAMAADYRVNSRHGTSPFECVADAKSAVRYIRQHAAELGINPDRIIAAGGSAGGHIAACTALVAGEDEPGEDGTISSVPDALILFNPVLDTTVNRFGGRRFTDQRRKEISPCHTVREGVGPTVLFHGTGDTTVPFENAERFTALMKEAGNSCVLHPYEDATHGFFNGESFRPRRRRPAGEGDAAPQPAEEEPTAFEKTMEQTIAFLTEHEFIDGEQVAVDESAVGSADAPAMPNIIVIYTDDHGYGDASVLNPESKFETPNFDRIAREGIIFSNGHSADSICTPSRYSLLTGRYSWRTTMKRSVLGAEAPCLIADDRMTIASMLKDRGYHTGMVGKWHLGMDFPGTPGDRDWTQPVLDMPLDKGFDYFYGVPASLNYGILAWFEGRYAEVPPTQYTNKKKNEMHEDYRIMPPYHATPEETKAELDRPGFEIAPDFIDNQCLTKFTNKALQWMESKVDDAQDGKPFLLYLPYTSPHFPVCPLPEFQGQGECGAYGEFLIETDHHVGRILDFLEKSGLDENTMVVFTSDNGPEGPWRSHLRDFGHDSRGGFRQGKRSVYEGGHRVPFFIRWPAGIKSPGRTCDALVGQVDLLSTIAEVTGVTLPENAGEDSQSFAAVFKDPDSKHERLPLINRGNTGRFTRYAITDANWKLVFPNAKVDRFELYDLSVDPAESKNVLGEHPEIVKRLTAQINEIIASGRTTPGAPQANDTGYWDTLPWMTEAEYNEFVPK